MVHSRRSPLYFLTVISAAVGQRVSPPPPPSPICRYVLLNTTCGRRSRAVSRFGIFCGQGFAQSCRPTSATAIPQRWRCEENSGLQSLVSKLGCDFRFLPGRWATAVAFHSVETTCRDGAGAPQVSTILHQISWLTPPWHDSVNFKTRGASEAECSPFTPNFCPFFLLWICLDLVLSCVS